MNLQNIDLVIFDCDGVLVDSEPLANRVYVQLLAEDGFEVDENEYLREFTGASIPRRLEVTTQRLNWAPPQDFIHRFHERLATLIKTELKLIPGIVELLESLSMPICVASNGDLKEIALRLQVAHLEHFFQNAIFSGAELGHPKPEPDVYLAAAKAYQVPPSHCIVIDDSVPGVTAAVRAGMKVYGHAALTPPEVLKEAGAIPFANMFELKNILAE